MVKDDLKPSVVLGVAAHPDDLEFGVAGSIAKWITAGASVYYLICTDGSKGSTDLKMSSAELIKLRRREQQAAAKVLGVKGVTFLDYEDGSLESNLDLKRDIVRAIRARRPDTVVTMDPTFVYSTRYGLVSHSDHRAAGLATLDAVYPLARDHLHLPELLAEGLQPHKVKQLLLVNFDQPDYYVDVSGSFERKLEALTEHKSQLPDSEATKQMLRAQAEAAGKTAGCQLAEGYVRLNLPS